MQLECEFEDGSSLCFEVADYDHAMDWVLEQDRTDPPVSVWLDGEPWLGLCTCMDYGIP